MKILPAKRQKRTDHASVTSNDRTMFASFWLCLRLAMRFSKGHMITHGLLSIPGAMPNAGSKARIVTGYVTIACPSLNVRAVAQQTINTLAEKADPTLTARNPKGTDQ